MRKLALGCTIVAALAAPAAVAAAPVLPLHGQRAIKARAGTYAYMPARVPLGFRYYRWSFTAGARPALRIWFRNKAGWEIVFIASPQHGRCDAGKAMSFQLDGNKVWWSHTANEQQAWRCVTGSNGRAVRLTAATALPPTRFADVGLGQVAAAGRRIR